MGKYVKKPNPVNPGKRNLECFFCDKPQQEFEKRLNGTLIPLLRGRDGVPRHMMKKTSVIEKKRVHGPRVSNVGNPRFISANHMTKQNMSVVFGRDDHNRRLARKHFVQELKRTIRVASKHAIKEAIQSF